LAKFDLKAFARRGAEARLAELTREAKEILTAFPDLVRTDLPFQMARTKQTRKPVDLETSGAPANDVRRARRRRKMSAAQRKAVSARMRKYWADRKKV
jgi:hypothetical protein